MSMILMPRNLIYLSRPPGGENEKHLVVGYSCLSMMAKMAAVPPPNEWPTQTNWEQYSKTLKQYLGNRSWC